MTNTALSLRTDDAPLSVVQIKTQIQTIQAVMRDVMIDKVHYGTIPGCGDKPALLKPGAEKIMATFRLAADPEIEDLSTADETRYRIRVRMLSPAGVLVGVGVGECSSGEEKYKWRKAVCQEEFNETPEDRRRTKWGYGKQKPYQIKQVRTNPADVANTILKMAKKRALVDGVLTATAASDIFAQDIDEGLADPGSMDVADPVPQPKPPASGDPINDSAARVITALLAKAEITEAELCKRFNVGGIRDITMGNINEVTAWIQNPA